MGAQRPGPLAQLLRRRRWENEPVLFGKRYSMNRRTALRRLAAAVVVGSLYVAQPLKPAVAAPACPFRKSPATAPPALPEISAAAAVVVDDASGQVLYARNPHKRRAIASLTKSATAVVALERGCLNEVVRVSVRWSDLQDSTLMGLVRGDLLALEDLIYGLMLPSGNDAAVAIAHHIAHSEVRFVEMMNGKLRDLGLVDTHFENPHGLDAVGHYSTAYDLAQLNRYALRNPAFARIVATPRVELHGVRGLYPLRNLNALLHYYADADGVKIGYTDDAGLGVVASATREGRRLVAVLLRTNNYVGEAVALLDYFFGDGSQQATGASGESVPPSLDDPVNRPPRWQEPPARWDTPRQPTVVKLDGWSLWQ